jgi:hypothetical protein
MASHRVVPGQSWFVSMQSICWASLHLCIAGLIALSTPSMPSGVWCPATGRTDIVGTAQSRLRSPLAAAAAETLSNRSIRTYGERTRVEVFQAPWPWGKIERNAVGRHRIREVR